MDLTRNLGQISEVVTVSGGLLQALSVPSPTDDDVNFATTSWVKSVGLFFSSVVAVAAATTLTTAHLGALVRITAATVTVTLPLAANCAAGSSITFVHNNASGSATLAAGAANTIIAAVGTSASTLVLPSANGVQLISDGVSAWAVANQTAVPFSASTLLAGNNSWTGTNTFTKQVSAPQISKGNLGATPAFDFATGNNFYGVANLSFTLPLPTNMVAGQAGTIEIQQDATGSRLITYATGWLFPGGLRPALSTAPSSLDVISYIVRTGATQVEATLNKGFA